jgi:hypothetical protein
LEQSATASHNIPGTFSAANLGANYVTDDTTSSRTSQSTSEFLFGDERSDDSTAKAAD